MSLRRLSSIKREWDLRVHFLLASSLLLVPLDLVTLVFVAVRGDSFANVCDDSSNSPSLLQLMLVGPLISLLAWSALICICIIQAFAAAPSDHGKRPSEWPNLLHCMDLTSSLFSLIWSALGIFVYSERGNSDYHPRCSESGPMSMLLSFSVIHMIVGLVQMSITVHSVCIFPNKQHSCDKHCLPVDSLSKPVEYDFGWTEQQQSALIVGCDRIFGFRICSDVISSYLRCSDSSLLCSLIHKEGIFESVYSLTGETQWRPLCLGWAQKMTENSCQKSLFSEDIRDPVAEQWARQMHQNIPPIKITAELHVGMAGLPDLTEQFAFMMGLETINGHGPCLDEVYEFEHQLPVMMPMMDEDNDCYHHHLRTIQLRIRGCRVCAMHDQGLSEPLVIVTFRDIRKQMPVFIDDLEQGFKEYVLNPVLRDEMVIHSVILVVLPKEWHGSDFDSFTVQFLKQQMSDPRIGMSDMNVNWSLIMSDEWMSESQLSCMIYETWFGGLSKIC